MSEEKKEVKPVEHVTKPEVIEKFKDEHLPAHFTGTSPVLAARTPAELIKKAKEIATLLKDIIIQRKLFVKINDKPFVYCEAWTTMGAMLNVFPYTVWTRRMEGNDIAWESRVELRTLDGKVISAGEAMCSSAEAKWRDRDENMIRSMSQTRATSKSYRLPFAWIIVMAGYEPTPAEEMEGMGRVSKKQPKGKKDPATLEKKEVKPPERVTKPDPKPTTKAVWPDVPSAALVKKYITQELIPNAQNINVNEGGTKVPLSLLLSTTRDKKSMPWKERLLGCRNHLIRAQRDEPAQLTKWLKGKK